MYRDSGQGTFGSNVYVGLGFVTGTNSLKPLCYLMLLTVDLSNFLT
jgi:hypothetical protein